MFDAFLIDHPLVVVAVWAVIYVSDYYMTLWGARLFKEVASAFIDLDGSYELEKVHQKDVDALRRISPTFLWHLFLGSALLLIVWWLSVRSFDNPYFFLLFVGGYLFPQVVVHFRHVRNILMFRRFKEPGAVEGRIRYARWFTEESSVVEITSFSVLFAICFGISGDLVFLGGAIASFSMARGHARQAKRSRSRAVPTL